jgi:hypothetical protein
MTTKLVVFISFSSHNTTFASRHIFTNHDALWLFCPLNERFRSLSLTYTPINLGLQCEIKITFYSKDILPEHFMISLTSDYLEIR